MVSEWVGFPHMALFFNHLNLTTMNKVINFVGTTLLTAITTSILYLFVFASNGQWIANIITR